MTEPSGPAQPDRDTAGANRVEADAAEHDTAEGEHDADEPGQPGGTRRKAGVDYKPL